MPTEEKEDQVFHPLNEQHGGFDFNLIETEDIFESMDRSYFGALYHEFHKTTDIPEIFHNPDIECTTVEEKGFWEADRYFTMHLERALQRLGFEKFDNEQKLLGNSLISVDNNVSGVLNGAFVLCLGFKVNIDNPVHLMSFERDYEQIGNEILENTPFIVFQHYDGPISVTYHESILELNQPEYKCYKDAMVFKGVFKAEKDGDNYRLKKIFDKYFFNFNGAISFNKKENDYYPSDELKVKCSVKK